METNILATQKVSVLLKKFAIPSIVAMLVSALYNIIDQFFIGQKIGEAGNAATNIAFPLSISCVAIALLFGIGGAAAFNLSMGQGKKKEAVYYIGNAITMMLICGCILSAVTLIFLEKILVFFGSPQNTLEYAKQYTSITAIGFPAMIIGAGGGHLIRADGRPQMTMIVNMTGAIINTILDALFVFGLNLGMKGAALATVIGQVISALIAVYCFVNLKSTKLKLSHLLLKFNVVNKITSLGIAPCFNQLAMMVVQVVMNKTLKYYGSISEYGESIPIACVGIISKVNMIFMSFIIGISQGLQPIVGFNYGAGNYKRVKESYKLAMSVGFGIAVVAFGMFQLFPRAIIGMFGGGSDLYYRFAVSYFRVFLFFTFLNFNQPITANVFTAIGKPLKGVFLSLTRQILFLLPLIVILPKFIGINGVLYAGPIADLIAFIMCTLLIKLEFSRKEFKVNE